MWSSAWGSSGEVGAVEKLRSATESRRYRDQNLTGSRLNPETWLVRFFLNWIGGCKMPTTGTSTWVRAMNWLLYCTSFALRFLMSLRCKVSSIKMKKREENQLSSTIIYSAESGWAYTTASMNRISKMIFLLFNFFRVSRLLIHSQAHFRLWSTLTSKNVTQKPYTCLRYNVWLVNDREVGLVLRVEGMNEMVGNFLCQPWTT